MGAQGQAQATGSQATDTLNTKIVPIVLVPGVMGSRLDISTTASDWDPDDTLEMAGWLRKRRRTATNDMAFTTPAALMTDLIGAVGTRPSSDIFNRPRLNQIAGSQMDPKTPAASRPSLTIQFFEGRGWGEVSWTFYGPILMDMAERLNPGENAGETRPVYACGYDWRQSNKDSGIALRARIKQILGKHPLAKQVILVTHSMGGLVTRAALAQGAQSDIVGVLHTVIPAEGAVVAYRRFFTGAQNELGDNPGPLNLIMGKNRVQYSIMQTRLRGPTELLPSNSYPDPFFQFGAGITNKFVDVYLEYPKQVAPGFVPNVNDSEGSVFTNTITAGDVTSLKNRIREAGAFSASVAGIFHPNTFVLFGDQSRTDVAFDFRLGDPELDGSGKDARVTRLPQGDGTVPRASGRFDACTALARNGANVKHAECFGVPSFRTLVIERVRRLLALAP